MDSVQITSNVPYQDAHLDLDFNRNFAVLDSRRLVLTRCDW